MIIGLSGKAGSGKTTVARELARLLGGKAVSFADGVREEVARLTGVPLDVMRNHKETTHILVGLRLYLLREFMQLWGTDIRRAADPDYWVREIVKWSDPRETYIVDDVRFENEADAILAGGGVVYRIGVFDDWEAKQGSDHPSETALDKYLRFTRIFSPGYGELADLASEVVDDLKWRGICPKANF